MLPKCLMLLCLLCFVLAKSNRKQKGGKHKTSTTEIPHGREHELNPMVVHLKVTDIYENEKDYQAALINTNTVVSLSISDSLDRGMICFDSHCANKQSITQVSLYADYMFWKFLEGVDTIPKFFEGDILDAKCTINENSLPVDIDFNKRDGFSCIGCSETFDMLICNGSLAGIMEMNDDKLTTIFHPIEIILEAGGYVKDDQLEGAVQEGTPEPEQIKVFEVIEEENDMQHEERPKPVQRRTSATGSQLRAYIQINICTLYFYLL
ncbi:hypothetical protein Trydic_g9582 [Trypoxylus dichotomus]